MKHATTISRIILGLIFFVFGLNGFFPFIPMGTMPPEVNAFMGAMAATGYFIPVLALTQVTSGALLILNFYVPIALILLAPVIFQIVLFHIFLESGGMLLTVVLVILESFLAYKHWKYFSALFTKKCDV